MTVLVPFSMQNREPIRSASTHRSKPSTSSAIVFVTLELTSNILLENLSPVNHCDCAAPIRSPRSWANGFFKNRGSSCKRSLSLLPQLSRGQFVENRLRVLLSNRDACYAGYVCHYPSSEAFSGSEYIQDFNFKQSYFLPDPCRC